MMHDYAPQCCADTSSPTGVCTVVGDIDETGRPQPENCQCPEHEET